MSNFIVYDGDTDGLYTDKNHVVFKWAKGDIYFSATRRGDAMSCHFSSKKKYLRKVKLAIEEFINYVFCMNNWCKMVIAAIKKPSIERLCIKIGFFFVIRHECLNIYARKRDDSCI